ncbi:exosortase B [Ideonella sp. A 288]|uniref:exosortase B n=1 Tax=Ideonella sp. A 288 TaxID=1962181 RepID=UPI000B4B7672|nr:exosortase B [Ideonella sp. A 288]
MKFELSAWRSGDSALPALLVLAVGLLVAFVPVVGQLARQVWNTDEQGHGPIIFGVVLWLAWRRRDSLAASAREAQPASWDGWLVLVAGLLIYLVGRLQNILMFQVFALIPLLSGGIAVTFGWKTARLLAFPIFFILFAVPLPGPVVDMLTQPLKQGVSWVAEHLLYSAGYPVARSGVILSVGPYQLLVADACAGLNSMFSLEALGLLYMNIVGHTSRWRNIALAILIIPVSFCSNIVRVMILVLVTYYFGDEAGQGFVHDFAGMVLFIVALTLMMLVDSVLDIVFGTRKKR